MPARRARPGAGGAPSRDRRRLPAARRQRPARRGGRRKRPDPGPPIGGIRPPGRAARARRGGRRPADARSAGPAAPPPLPPPEARIRISGGVFAPAAGGRAAPCRPKHYTFNAGGPARRRDGQALRGGSVLRGGGGCRTGSSRRGIDVAAGIDSDPACKHPFESNVKARFVRNGRQGPDARVRGVPVRAGLPQDPRGVRPVPAVLVLQPLRPWREQAGTCCPGSGTSRSGCSRTWWPWKTSPGSRSTRCSKSSSARSGGRGYGYDYRTVNCAKYGNPADEEAARPSSRRGGAP